MKINGTYDVDSVGEDVEVIRADGAYRLCLMPDYEPPVPYNDGAAPVFEIGRNQHGFHQTRQVTEITDYDASYVEFVNQVGRWGVGNARVDSYLKEAYGATVVEWWNEGTYWYMSLDPAQWRDAMGVTVEDVAGEFEQNGSLMPEWRAFKTGDAWAYVIQQQVHWARIAYDPVTLVEPLDVMHTWETVDSLFGLYGRAYAEAEAREAYKALTGFPVDPEPEPEGPDPEAPVEGTGAA